MLFVLIGLLLVASVFVLLMKKNRESLYLLGMCCSLMVQFSGILIFIAKKGGYSKSIIGFLLSLIHILHDVMLVEKKMPDAYINEAGNGVTQAFLDWCAPLIGEPLEKLISLR